MVEFLRNAERSSPASGAKIPKGVLVGPPGTGRRCSRGPSRRGRRGLHSISGSEFVEMFVGWARRGRDLFKPSAAARALHRVHRRARRARRLARRQRPRHQRGARADASTSSSSRWTAFAANKGVIVPATNRPEISTRPSCAPAASTARWSSTALTARAARLSCACTPRVQPPALDLGEVAAAPGFAGADLANILNEAALLAARCKDSTTVAMADVDEAIERVAWPRASLAADVLRGAPPRRLPRGRPRDRRRSSPGGSRVVKISIVPRGMAASADDEAPHRGQVPS